MLDLGFVRANLGLVEERLRARGMDPAAVLGDFLRLDQYRRVAIKESEECRAKRKDLSKDIGERKIAGMDATALVEATLRLKTDSEHLDKTAADADSDMQDILKGIPNLPHESVPVGSSERDNVEVKKSEITPRVFDFKPRPHWEVAESLGILDLARAAKISGARFAVYWDQGARLERALANFMLDLHTQDHRYIEVLPPSLVNRASLFGTGQLPKFAGDLFRCADPDRENQEAAEEADNQDDIDYFKNRAVFNDHWLIPTAEVPVTNLYRDEVLDEAMLPLSLTAYTPCFRSEAGSYGKDVRGIIRQHQFQKVELVKFCRPEDSYAEHEKLTANAEAVLEKLGLPYRRMLLSTGDMGFSAAKTYDLEVWLPGQGLYREISSCSNFEAFQARRANIRYKPQGKSKSEFVHTLNGSALAVGRTWVAIVENYQQADGTVRVPDALVSYMGGETVIRPRKM